MDNSSVTFLHLLSQISAIRVKYEKIAEITGENFNIFRILNLNTNEVRTHSAFIGELLNNKGSHGFGDLFLHLFIEQQKERFQDQKLLARLVGFESNNSITITEEHLGFINQEQTEGGRIDLVIKDVHSKAIIIENKINAKDGINQLLRYHNAYPEAPIFHLSLKGTKPDQISSSNLAEGDHFVSISYESDIINWLEKCRKEAVSHSLLRESITQYINLIKYLTGQTMNHTEKLEIANLIVSNKDFLKTYLEMQQSDLFMFIRKQLIKQFLEQLKDVAINSGFVLSGDLDSFINGAKSSSFAIKPQIPNKDGYFLSFDFDSNREYSDLGYGIYNDTYSIPGYPYYHRTITEELLGKSLVDTSKKMYANWLWFKKFDKPFDNWNNIEVLLAMKDDVLLQKLNKLIQNLCQVIEKLKEQS
jgi:hypothetical protein